MDAEVGLGEIIRAGFEFCLERVCAALRLFALRLESVFAALRPLALRLESVFAALRVLLGQLPLPVQAL